ncbi:MAG TPA: hypothetical protein VLQ93_07620 [Myxococcaceae bacterium]|nr:hypothetical protein [Myxococcaceae bacterium]
MKSVLLRLASDLLTIPSIMWLGLGATLWASGGCLIPQEESYLSELPQPRNRPPRIVESQVQPSERIIRGYGADLCKLEFSIIVEDPDIGDLISAHWYVDYDPTHSKGADLEYSLTPSSKPLREDRAYFREDFGALGSKLSTPGDHLVEVIISDSRLVGREPQPRIIKLPDGTDFADPGYTATYAWFVKTVPGGDCQ